MVVHFRQLLVCLVVLVVPLLTFAAADESKEETAASSSSKTEKVKMVPLTLAGGSVRVSVPETWKREKPRSRILEQEFSIPPHKDDKLAGRLTIMPSGGSVKANVERWYTQFTQPDKKKATKDVAKVEEKKINGQEAVIVDISGTFKERLGGGPFAPGKTVERENYRMLAGIVQTKTQRKFQYFFKLYGPKQTIDAAEKHFLQMMESVTSQ